MIINPIIAQEVNNMWSNLWNYILIGIWPDPM
jgi:hypothetical protein